jgi:hypothetical protein
VPSRWIVLSSVLLLAVIVLFFTAFPPPAGDISVVTVGEVAAGYETAPLGVLPSPIAGYRSGIKMDEPHAHGWTATRA